MTEYEKIFGGFETLKEYEERERHFQKWQKEVSKNIKKELDKKGYLTAEEATKIMNSTTVS